MRILLVSYYAEAHLPSSSAQNIRLLAETLVAKGHAVRVVCAAAAAGTESVDGYLLKKLPISSSSRKPKWLAGWRPDPRIREIAREELATWRPDIVVVGAWKGLTELGLEARRLDIPVVQVVHDYSLICLRQWLLDRSGALCTGPTSERKCLDCMSHPPPRAYARARNHLASLTPVRRLTKVLLGRVPSSEQYDPLAVEEALTHMAAYRHAVTRFVAQAPSVVDLLGSAGIAPEQCRFLPQFIGEDRLRRYRRPEEPPGAERPLRFVYVGRWSPMKGTDTLLEAFSAARATLEIELWIISRNVDPAALDRVSAAGGSRRIRAIKSAEGAEVSRLLAQCDVCVVPSRCRELASRVVVEAHAQGVPVIASSTVGNSYLITDHVNGRIFESGNVEALRRCIEEVAAAPSSMGGWSRELAAPIEREDWTRRVLEILEEATERNIDEADI